MFYIDKKYKDTFQSNKNQKIEKIKGAGIKILQIEREK